MRIFSIVLSGLVHEQVKLDNDLERLINNKTLPTDDLVGQINELLDKQVMLTMKINKWQEIQNNVSNPDNKLETE